MVYCRAQQGVQARNPAHSWELWRPQARIAEGEAGILDKGHRKVVARRMQGLGHIGSVHSRPKGNDSPKLTVKNVAVLIQTIQQKREHAPIRMPHENVVFDKNILGCRSHRSDRTEVGIDVHGRGQRVPVLPIMVWIEVNHLPRRVAGASLKGSTRREQVPAVGTSAESVQKVQDSVARRRGFAGPGEVGRRENRGLPCDGPRRQARECSRIAAGLGRGRPGEHEAQGGNKPNDQGNGFRRLGARARSGHGTN